MQKPIVVNVTAISGTNEARLLLAMMVMGIIHISMKIVEHKTWAGNRSMLRLSATRYGISVRFNSV